MGEHHTPPFLTNTFKKSTGFYNGSILRLSFFRPLTIFFLSSERQRERGEGAGEVISISL